jgi:hypothetical protein
MLCATLRHPALLSWADFTIKLSQYSEHDPRKECCDTWEISHAICYNKLPILQMICLINYILDPIMMSFTLMWILICSLNGREWGVIVQNTFFCPQSFRSLSFGHKCIMLGIWISVICLLIMRKLFHTILPFSPVYLRHWTMKTSKFILLN